jgi:hypothetical protein
MDGIIFSLKMEMAKEYVNQNFNKRWVVHNFNNTFKRWVVHNLLKILMFEIKGWSTLNFHKKKQNNYIYDKNKHRPDGSLFQLSKEQELSQGHNKENK